MTAYNTDFGRRDANSTFRPMAPPTAPETAVYTIFGTFCEPIGGGNGTVLLATHGAGYDRLYVASLFINNQKLIGWKANGILKFNQKNIVLWTLLLRKDIPSSSTIGYAQAYLKCTFIAQIILTSPRY
jgi:hypothetical protein